MCHRPILTREYTWVERIPGITSPGSLAWAFSEGKELLMAGASDRLTRWADPVFGDLAWDEGALAWIGCVQFGGRSVGLELDPDRTQPTREDQLAVREPSRITLETLRDVEPDLRRQAAEQIAEAVIEQQNQVELPKEGFADTLELECISLHGSGELHYRSSRYFPGQHVTVYFNEDWSFGDAEVYD
jgi:hypothetical protein